MSSKPPSLFSFPGFRNLLIGQLISQLGDTFRNAVLLWMVLDFTGNKGSVGLVATFEALPFALLSLHSGALADRIDRRRILVGANIVAAVLTSVFIAILVMHPRVPVAVICIFAFVMGSIMVYTIPARSSAIPRLVPEDRLLEANGFNAAMQNLMPLIGSAISAIVLGALFALDRRLAYAMTFGFDALTFIASAAFMLRLPAIPPIGNSESKDSWREAFEGVRFIRGHKVLLLSVLLSVGCNFFAAPFYPAFVVLAKDRFHGGPNTLALIETGFFLGMVIGAVVVMRMKIRRPGLAMGIAFIIVGLICVPMAYVHSLAWFWVLNLVCGFFVPLGSTPIQTFIQLETPDELRGRVAAASANLAVAINPVGAAMSSVLLASLGMEGTILYIAIGFAVPPLLALFSREFRNARMPVSNGNLVADT